MSVLVKGMEMPKEGGTIVVYKISGKFFAARAGKDELFPLVPVPPHGRLIDAEWVNKALIETLEALKKNPKMDKEEMHLISAFHTIGVMVADAPTIIPAEPCNDLAKPNNDAEEGE